MATNADLLAAELFLSPCVLRRIEGSVKRLCRKFGLSRADGDDLQQDFCVAILQSRQVYDQDKCLLHRFVLMVINRRYKHHVRRLIRIREGLGNTIDSVGFDDVEPGLDLLIVDPVGENPHRSVDLRDELDHAMRGRPDFEKRVCDLLMAGHSPFGASRELNVAPSTVTRAMKRIASHLAMRDGFSDF
jgi:DNA-directed RNA polymerase specialized sigma24 family protein